MVYGKVDVLINNVFWVLLMKLLVGIIFEYICDVIEFSVLGML